MDLEVQSSSLFQYILSNLCGVFEISWTSFATDSSILLVESYMSKRSKGKTEQGERSTPTCSKGLKTDKDISPPVSPPFASEGAFAVGACVQGGVIWGIRGVGRQGRAGQARVQVCIAGGAIKGSSLLWACLASTVLVYLVILLQFSKYLTWCSMQSKVQMLWYSLFIHFGIIRKI